MKSFIYIDGEFEFEQEIRRSKFITTLKGEVDASEAEEFLRAVRKRYGDATHNCFAYVADELGNVARFSDDGEPSGTAGQPILDVLKKQELKKSIAVVTRYFGGIKLGAGGLVSAYSSSVSEALKRAKISKKAECKRADIFVDYALSSSLDKHIRESGVTVEEMSYLDGVSAKVFVPIDDYDKFLEGVNELSFGSAKILRSDEVAFKRINCDLH